jgi:choline dehydrogenase-like flavoprotein
MDKMKQKYDFLIIGGGSGGTPTAMALASAGKQVLLVEKGQGLGVPACSKVVSRQKYCVNQPVAYAKYVKPPHLDYVCQAMICISTGVPFRSTSTPF